MYHLAGDTQIHTCITTSAFTKQNPVLLSLMMLLRIPCICLSSQEEILNSFKRIRFVK